MHDAVMTVRVTDRSGWGTRGPYPVVVSVEIRNRCSVCNEPRGTPRSYRFFENGDWHTVDVWDNPCGHVDKYDDVLTEAKDLERQNREGANQ